MSPEPRVLALPEISVVVPVCNEEGNVPHLYARVREVLDEFDSAWEIIYVDDGSEDATWHQVCQLNIGDRRVRGVRLSRNFGHQSALLAGLDTTRGAAVICMDGDLQHPPELLPELLQRWREGAMVVRTVRREAPSTSRFKRWTSRCFYGLLARLGLPDAQPGMSDFGLLDRRVVRELLRLQENQLFLRGLVRWVGFPSCDVEYQAADRIAGETKYTLPKMLKFAATGITSVSVTPLRLSIVAGCCAAFLGFAELAYVLYVALVQGDAVPGWASILVVISFFFGFLFLYLGVLGEYLGRIFENVKGRPAYIVRDHAGSTDALDGRRLSAREDTERASEGVSEKVPETVR